MNAFFSVDSTSLIALHGWGMDASSWDALLPLLENKLPFKAVNLPGYANSPVLPSMNMDAVVDWLAEQFEGKCHLLGWSMGGLVALAFAHKYPGRVVSLSLVGATPCFTKKSLWPHALPADTLNNFAENLKDNRNLTLRRFIALQFMGKLAAAKILKGLRQKVTEQKTSTATLELGLSWLSGCDYRAVLSELKMKQHWMLGELDQLVPVEIGTSLKAEQAGIEISYLESCGHAPHISQPEHFVAKLLPFISQHASK